MNGLKYTATGLAKSSEYRDNCGLGLTAHIRGLAEHNLIEQAIDSLLRMAHRGAINADGKTGDGCGLMLQMPHQFFQQKCSEINIKLAQYYAVGVIFLSPKDKDAQRQQKIINDIISQYQDKYKDIRLAGWREVPTDISCLGEIAKRTMPSFWHVFINIEIGDKTLCKAMLYKLKRSILARLRDEEHFYIASLSCDTISYKGIILSSALQTFYADLNDNLMKTAICLFHQRFATNTAPQWRLAHPFQYISHNGEVNTISGNRNWAKARFSKFKYGLLSDLSDDIPLVDMNDSDSMSLDNILELLLAGGMDIFRSLRMIMPPAWQNNNLMNRQVYSFHEYNSTKMEPWDGPANILLTEGRYAICALDRNGLRPAKWVLGSNNVIVLASEVGIKNINPKDIVDKGRVEPGGIIAVDTSSGMILRTEQIDNALSMEYPYKSWLKKQLYRLEATIDNPVYEFDDINKEKLNSLKKLFCFHDEEREYVMRPLAEKAQEAVAAMGDDTPMAVMSQENRLITDYFRQKFAQVTNPAIDPIRENMVMSLETFIGKESNIFAIKEESAHRIALNSPILSPYKFQSLKQQEDMKVVTLDSLFNPKESLQKAIEKISSQAVKQAKAGATIIIVSDRATSEELLPIPMPMALGAIHHSLIDNNLRCDVNLIAETAYAREPHQFAVLLGLGVTAIYPYFAYAILDEGVREALINVHPQRIFRNYRMGIDKGLLKIISKMGISTIASYRGAQLFEVIGINSRVISTCFKGISSRIEGVGFSFFDKEIRQLAQSAWNKNTPVKQGGLIKYVHGHETHAFGPDIVETIRKAVRDNSKSDYKKYVNMVDGRYPMYLRDLLGLKKVKEPIPLDEIEPQENILRRFDSAAMSLGALSPEAHKTLAVAMNDLGGRSNSGEGGEDEKRFNSPANSKIKQIASGRFGVTPHYLVNAEVLQIKIAQGAKPGEGGQLPGGKVNTLIARLRFSSPGITLISPPPHHDIYSIEDLAQLIYDLKEVNPKALVSVKLVSLPGVGTIAAGVAKCRADLITISGYDGGTAASPLSSIRYAGSPWELGLSETHQALQLNGFRDKVRLQVDGGLKTGLDVIKAALLGAESFGFGTTPMIAMGCKYLRLCHLNNCPTGVATQHKRLRDEHFIGNAEAVKNFFYFIANEVRGYLSQLGYRAMDEIIGRPDLFERKPSDNEKHSSLDISRIIAIVDKNAPRFCSTAYNETFRVGNLAQKIKEDTQDNIGQGKKGNYKYEICNQDRAIGGGLSGIIAQKYGLNGIPDTPINLSFTGTAGQSFGAWNISGVNLRLHGSSNDYVGKGMAGGKIVITMSDDKNKDTMTLAGNTCLYGATGGKMFVGGNVGERFAVRNSGALAIIEGAGDHCCEYMTGGVVVVLGPTGNNFGAGMTGGVAYVWDPERMFADKYNEELIEIDKIVSEEMEIYRNYLRQLMQEFVTETKSLRVGQILEDFYDHIARFWLVKPKASSAASLIENIENRAA